MAHTGTVLILAMKDNDYVTTEFPGTTAGLQAAIDHLEGGKGKVFVGPGTISVTSAMTLGSNVMVEGCGEATVLQRSGSALAINVFKDAAAVSNVTIRNLTFDNNSLAVSTYDVLFTNGSSNITVEGCRWYGLTGRVSDLLRMQAGATGSSRISIRNNYVVGPGAEQTYNSFQIYDSSEVDVSGNSIEGWGAIKCEVSSLSTAYGWSICGNRFNNVDQTNIFTRIQNASSVAGVVVSGNVATDCGKSFLQCCCIGASDSGTIKEVSIAGNTVRGFGVSLLDDAIQVGGINTTGTFYCTNVSVVGNAINGLDSGGTLQTTTERGISVEAGTQYVSIYANSVRNCGRSGIGIGASDCIVSGNMVERCVRKDTTASAPTPLQEGGIATFGNGVYACNNVLIVGNLCKNNGVDGTTVSNGITISGNNTGTSSRHHAFNNRCYDDQGTQTQAHGIAIGKSGGTLTAFHSQIIGNDLTGNKTGGVSALGTLTGVITDRNVDTANTLGTGTTTASAATVTLPAVGDSFTISGTADISSITASWIGRRVTLIFSGTAAASGLVDGSNLKLASTLAYTPDDTISLLSDGTNWIETGRSVN